MVVQNNYALTVKLTLNRCTVNIVMEERSHTGREREVVAARVYGI